MDNKSHNGLIFLENVTLRIRDRRIFPATTWQIKNGQNWVVIGSNGSGKTTLLRAITGRTPVVHGKIHRFHAKAQPTAIGYVSFEKQQQLIVRERLRDDARFFSGVFNDELTAGQLIQTAMKDQTDTSRPEEKILSSLSLDHLMERSLRNMSNGELRKVLIGCAILKSKGLLVLDEPFEGLDAESRHKLAASIRGLVHSGLQMILATHQWDYILPEFSHALGLKDGAVFCQGLRKEILNRHHIEKLYGRPSVLLDSKRTTVSNSPGSDEKKETPLIQLKNVTVQYGNQVVFKDLTWTVHKGDNWAVSGPNGSGKTTLLQIIAGDHPQAYANEIYLFGRRRGSGESIWEIKQRIGLVSSEFQIAYRKPIRALDVVVSGFFDSIGLYRYASQQQRKAAQQWIERLALTHLQDKRFDLLSYGERRLILLARAMVKTPDLLVLDEPCQGLDPTNRRLVRDCVDGMIFQTTTQLLYVTHFTEEIPGCITHHFDLSQQSA